MSRKAAIIIFLTSVQCAAPVTRPGPAVAKTRPCLPAQLSSARGHPASLASTLARSPGSVASNDTIINDKLAIMTHYMNLTQPGIYQNPILQHSRP